MCGLVEDELRAFNLERLYATDKATRPRTIVEAARTLPMMGDRRVVVVMRAERLLKPKKRGKDADEESAEDVGEPAPIDVLVEYIQRPEPLTTLVFVAEDANRTTKLFKALQKHATMVECWGLRSGRDGSVNLAQAARQAEQLVRQAVQQAKQQIEPAAARLLAQRAGTDIATLRGDVERLLLYAAGKPIIDVKDVREVVSAETAQDDWAVTNAIEQGNVAEALKQVAMAIDGGTAPEMILGQLGWFVRTKLTDPRRVPAAVDALFRSDLELKSTRTEARVLMERLVIELCRR